MRRKRKTFRIMTLFLVFITLAFTGYGCEQGGGTSGGGMPGCGNWWPPTNTNTDTDTGTETVTETDTETDTNTETETVTDTDTETDTDTNTWTITDTDTETDTDTNTWTITDTDTETDTDTNTGTETVTDTDTETNTETETVTDTDTNTDTNPATHVENPFEGGQGYLNPDYTQKVNDAADNAGDSSLASKMSSVATYPTAIWLDRIAAIEGTDEVTGLREHLDNALADGSDYIMIVVYDLPNRDCAAYASNGELLIAEDGMNRYKNEYIDPIVEIVSDSKYSSLRIIAIVEPDSLPNLVTNVDSSELCREASGDDGYAEGIIYAVDNLHPINNVYLYVDIAHSGWLGWDDNFQEAVQLYANTFGSAAAGYDSIDGFITNTANYTPTEELYLTNPAMDFSGMPVRSADFYEWNPYFDELDYATEMRQALINAGFPSNIGMLIDTSRNGWGGSDRPGGESSSSDLNSYVDESRIDTRPHRGGWCNQDGAGIGERPTASPASGIDAFVWVKPPGESDGVASEGVIDPDDPNKTFDTMCDPNAQSRYNESYPTNALPGAPHAGRWFQEQFEMLVENAEPPL